MDYQTFIDVKIEHIWAKSRERHVANELKALYVADSMGLFNSDVPHKSRHKPFYKNVNLEVWNNSHRICSIR